jgi:hypothetical protein
MSYKSPWQAGLIADKGLQLPILIEENCVLKDRPEGQQWHLLTAGENGIA